MIRKFWRLTDGGEDNLGPAITEAGLVLGRTPLIERRNQRFVVRERAGIERLLKRAYRADVATDRLMPGLKTVAAALNANDPRLAHIAAVHLRIPDLPDRAARDGMEAEDIVVKYGDWNPALHPRTGVPPNPGWFASTDGSSDESSWTRTAQNDNPTQRSDAADSIGQDRVILPPGERNDELGDFLEWIANAKPADETPIRAEIKRRYYDVGDASGGDALATALSNVLGPGVAYKDRQKILDAIGPYSVPAGDPTVDLLTDAGLLSLGMLPPAAGLETASAAWELGWAARGIYFSEQLDANLPAAFPVIDRWLDGIVTSIKSIDLRAATYQDAARLTYRLNGYIDKLVLFDGDEMGGIVIRPSDISSRVLSLAVPKGSMTTIQRAAIEAARLRARAFEVDLVITPF